MALQPNERELVNYVEQVYLLQGSMPEVSELSLALLIPELQVAAMLGKNEIKEALTKRGITAVGASPGMRLSERQLACANLMLDFTDGRSEKRKLDDIEVTTQEYQAWLRNPVFKNYMQNRAESLLGDHLHTAHTALLDSVRTGDVPALKLYYEMTGRWSGKTVGEMNIQFFMAKVLEVIQRHVEPEQMRAIAAEFEVISQGLPLKELA